MPRLLLAASLFLLASSCSRQNSVPVDAGLLTFVPDDTVSMAGVRFDQILKTPVWTRYANDARVVKLLDDLKAETGFDARKDLWELLWVSDGKESLLLARGQFSQIGLEPEVKTPGAKRMSYKGYTMLGDEKNAVLFLSPSTAAAGATPRLRQLIDSRDTKRTGPPKMLADKLAAIPRSTQIWMVATPAALPLPTPSEDGSGDLTGNMLRNLPNLLRSVQILTAAFDLSYGLEITLTADCSDQAGAKQVNDALRGMLGIARFSLPRERQDLLPVLDSFNVQIVDKQTTLHAKLELDSLDKLTSFAAPKAD